MSYRIELIALAIALIIIGAVVQHFAPISEVSFLGYIILIVGVIVGIIWVILIAIDAIRRNS